MTTVNGLPAHILLVHAVVVLVPLTAVLLVLVAVHPAARARLSGQTALLGVLTLAAVPLTTDAGEWLEHRVPATPLVREHAGLGDTLLPWAVGLAVLGLAILVREVLAARAARRACGDGRGGRGSAAALPGGAVLTGVLAVLVLVVAVGSVVTVYRIGDSGARAVWTGQFSQGGD